MLVITKTNILGTSAINEEGKTYSHIFSGKTISSHDFQTFVIHKRKIKEIGRKDIGDKMKAIYVCPQRKRENTLDNQAVYQGLQTYRGYNEETGQKYNFFPSVSPQKAEKLESTFQKLGIKISFAEQNKMLIADTYADNKKEQKETTKSILSLLYSISLIYGKRETIEKKTETRIEKTIKNIKIQMPLINTANKEKEEREKRQKKLQEEHLFLEISNKQTDNGYLMQIMIKDYDILKQILFFHKEIEKIENIYTQEHTQKRQELLKEYLKEDKKETVDILEGKQIKIVTKQ